MTNVQQAFEQIKRRPEKEKRRSSPKLEEFLSPKSSKDLKKKKSKDHPAPKCRLLEGMQSNYWGDISPPGFITPAQVPFVISLSCIGLFSTGLKLL